LWGNDGPNMRLSLGIKVGFWLALLGAAFTALTGYYFYDRGRALLIQAAQQKLLTATKVLGHNFGRSIAEITADVLFVAGLPEVKQISQLTHGRASSPADTVASAKQRAQLAEIFTGLLATRNRYSQVRLIGSANFGRELVRVERIADGSRRWRIVQGEDLQEKKHQPYFYETMRLAPGQLYVSPVSLNKEQGSSYGFGKPSLRVATPIHTQGGHLFGIVVIDVDLGGLFELLLANMPQGLGVLLTNQQGDYLIHPDPGKTFGFEQGRVFRIQDDLPSVEPLFENKIDQAVLRVENKSLGQHSLLAMMRLPIATLAQQRFVTLGLYTPIEKVLVESRRTGASIIQITLLFAFLSMLLALILARLLAKPMNQMVQAVRQHALGQPLPPLPVERNDEIGDLARSFVGMTAKIDQQMQAIQAAETQLHAILDHAPVGIWLMDTNGRYRFVNETFCNAVGMPESRFLATAQLADLLGDEAAVVSQASNQRCLIEQQPVFGHEAMVFADGNLHHLEVTKVQLPDNAGGIVGIIGIANDVTERQRLQNREKTRSEVLERLANGASLAEILQAIVCEVEMQSPALRCAILLLAEDGRHLRIGAASNLPSAGKAALDGWLVSEGNGSCGTAAFRGQRVVVEDVSTSPLWANYREVAKEMQIGASWSEPIWAADGRVLGTFAVYQSKVTLPSKADIQFIEQTASLAGIAIERSRNIDEIRLAAMVYQHSSEAMAVTDAENRIIAINPAFTRLTGYELSEVIGQNPRILNSGHHEVNFFKEMWSSILATGCWQGEIWNRHKSGEVFVEALSINTIFSDDGAVYRRVSLFYDITEKKRSEELIWRQANFDSHTGLPNRRMFYDRLEQMLKIAHRTGLPVALMFIDLDHFKEVNDTLGHDVGDILLHEAARRLTRCVRESDTVARMGGDEFTVILGEIGDTDGVSCIAQAILHCLAEPFLLGGETVYVSASIGITLYPDDADDADLLIKNADQAMYAAKRHGRNRYSHFTAALQESTQTRMRMTTDLHHALLENQFQLHYQPIVDLNGGAIHKAEALIRWQHPSRGLIRPDEFIPVAEETGLIVALGHWVFFEAARQVALWRAAYQADLQISVNKSPVQFRSEETDYEAWFEHLRQLGLPGQSIVIEITESLLLDASSETSDRLLRFRDAGMQVSLDDFGTGYSSLAYLKKFEIDYLKIDQSFICNLTPASEDMAICEAMIVMAHKLGMKVIAEGIETQAQCDLLTSIGCDFGQGYLFSRPIPAEEFEQLLKSHQR
jgi:diguanylate cyclase (GGDEF)-like protein/PAS domain S-box-containing protein